MKLENQKRIKTTILALLAAGSMMLTTSSSLYASSQFNASPVTVATMKTAQKVAQKPQVLNSIQILLNGKKATINDPIVSVKGTTLLPVRNIGELLNCVVGFDNNSKVALVKSGDTTLEIPLGYSFIVNNGQVKQTPAASLGYNSKTYLPVRAISENLPNVSIKYYSDTHTISITTDGSEPINASTPAPTQTSQAPTASTSTSAQKGSPNWVIAQGLTFSDVDPSYLNRTITSQEFDAMFPKRKGRLGDLGSKVYLVEAHMNVTQNDFKLNGYNTCAYRKDAVDGCMFADSRIEELTLHYKDGTYSLGGSAPKDKDLKDIAYVSYYSIAPDHHTVVAVKLYLDNITIKM